MSAIDEIVARSRLPGGFASQRKTFSLARKRAIRKMREFALADPYYFVLELIQAAVAQGASYINVKTDRQGFTLSYTGGRFREEELAQLFDFLFAGKNRTDIGHVRELALGLNALLLFQPERIVVESGDGTLAGTTRMVIEKDAEHVEVGRSARPLQGTFVRAEGLRRWKLRSKTALDPLPGLPLEVAAIEERCLTAPIPVVVNGDPLFGFSTLRVPRLLGYGRTLEFDEGDLYGVLGIQPQAFQASFKLLTFGVWIQTVTHDLLPRGQAVGGIICFDHLHKTADHSGIVQDERWAEMWARLRPYAERLAHGETGVVHGELAVLSGATITARELRPLLRASDRVCLVDTALVAESREGQLAGSIGRVLESLVLRVEPRDEVWLRGLGGPKVSLLRLDLSGDGDATFYLRQAPAEAPARPWLATEVALAARPLSQVLDGVGQLLVQLGGLGAGDSAELGALRDLGEVQAMVFTPAEPPAGTRLTVQLITVDRVAWEGHFPSAFPGHVLQVRLPDCSPRRLQARLGQPGQDRSLGRCIAWVMAHRAVPALATAARRALARGAQDEHEGSAARAIALAALQRSLVVRVQGDDDGRPVVRFALLGEEIPDDLLDRPLFSLLGGGWASPRDLEAQLNAQGGLLYGVLDSVPPALEGLDPRSILQLHEDEERMLLSLVGDAAYVRVDQRDVLADKDGVRCRDLALGLRAYPDFALLVEGADPTRPGADDPIALVEDLVIQLARVFAGVEPAPPPAPALAAWEENRRHACRHLQYFVCRRAARQPDLPDFGVADLPLFLDPEGRPWTFRQVQRALARPAGLTLLLRPALGGSELGTLTEAARLAAPATEDDAAAPVALWASPFTCQLLAPLGRVRFALDHPLPHEITPRAERAGDQPFLQRVEVSGDGFTGVVGVPTDPAVAPEVYLLEAKGGDLRAVPDVARRFGMLGLVRLGAERPAGWEAQVEDALREAGEALVAGLLAGLADLSPEDEAFAAAVARLLSFAGEHLYLVAEPDGHLDHTVLHPLAERVLELPLFPTADGVRLSGRRLVEAFCAYGPAFAQGPPAGRGVALHRAPPHLQAWMERYLNVSRVARPASGRSAPLPPGPEWADRRSDAPVAWSVEHWLEQGRPDHLRTRDTLDRAPFRVQVRSGPLFANFSDSSQLLAYTYFEQVPTLLLNGDHWLVAHARAQMAEDPLALMTLLLAVYAHVNAALDPVTNEHEQIFQLRLMEALARDELRPIFTAPVAAGPSSPSE